MDDYLNKLEVRKTFNEDLYAALDRFNAIKKPKLDHDFDDYV